MKMQLGVLLGVATLFALGSAHCCHAAKYYVDSLAGRDSNPGTIDAPWQTIQRAAKWPPYPYKYLQPGDTVFLRAGVYRGNTNAIALSGDGEGLPGTPNAPITVAAYPGDTVIVCDQTSPYRGVLISHLSWWVFDGITFSNCYQSVWQNGCTNMVWKNCRFGWMPNDAGYSGVQIFGNSQYTTISNCTFIKWAAVTEACNDSGTHLSIGDPDNDNPMFYNLVVSNRFFWGGHDNLAVYSAYNVFRGNLFVNSPHLRTSASCYTMSIGQTVETNVYGAYGNRHMKPGDAGTFQIDMRNVWEHNTFLYTGPPPDDDGAFGIELGTRQSIYRFNAIAYSLAAGIFFNTAGGASLSTSNAVYGNVLYKNGLSHVYGGRGMQAYSCGLSMSTLEGRRTNNFVVNNIIWRNHPANVDPDILLYQEFRGNFTNAASDPLFVGTNGLQFITNASDWFECYNATNVPDFRLQTNSPCIDAGTWLAFATSADNGTALSVDNSLYFSDGNRIVTGDTIQLQGQTNRAVVLQNDWTNNVLYLDRAMSWTNGQGVSLAYNGSAPDMGAYESQVGSKEQGLRSPTNLRVITNSVPR